LTPFSKPEGERNKGHIGKQLYLDADLGFSELIGLRLSDLKFFGGRTLFLRLRKRRQTNALGSISEINKEIT